MVASGKRGARRHWYANKINQRALLRVRRIEGKLPCPQRTVVFTIMPCSARKIVIRPLLGYFGVTLSPSHIERVRRYILNQEEHHRHRSFEEEYIEMLKLAGIEYDERYVW